MSRVWHFNMSNHTILWTSETLGVGYAGNPRKLQLLSRILEYADLKPTGWIFLQTLSLHRVFRNTESCTLQDLWLARMFKLLLRCSASVVQSLSWKWHDFIAKAMKKITRLLECMENKSNDSGTFKPHVWINMQTQMLWDFSQVEKLPEIEF
jgi:hypothetical protein